jgi:hypothetical protein
LSELAVGFALIETRLPIETASIKETAKALKTVLLSIRDRPMGFIEGFPNKKTAFNT